MRMKTINAFGKVVHRTRRVFWRILGASLPIGASNGLRTR